MDKPTTAKGKKTKPNIKTNMASIACVIIWGDTIGKVSHYFAGDCYWEQELSIVNWIKGSDRDAISIGAMKLSHHGAKTSSPAAVFDYLSPATVIVSAGTGTGYGHPRRFYLAHLGVNDCHLMAAF